MVFAWIVHESFAQPVPSAKLDLALPPLVRGAERRLLDRAEQFLKDQQWEDAVALLKRLLESPSVRVVPVKENHYEGLRSYCHRRIAALPAEALDRYRQLVDASSQGIYAQAIARRDVSLLQNVVDKYFCSSWGDDALLAVGELALQRGDYTLARSAWQRLRPTASVTEGSLSYPDSEFSPAEVEAWLVLVSIREGNFSRARQELQQFEARHSNAEGRLGGKTVPLAAALRRLLLQAREWDVRRNAANWPTFAANEQRTAWQRSRLRPGRFELIASLAIENPRFAAHPVIFGNQAVCFDGRSVHTYHISSGEISTSSLADIVSAEQGDSTVETSLIHTLSCLENTAYGITNPINSLKTVRTPNLHSTCWGVDLQREGALALQLQTANPTEEFTAIPLVDESRLWLPIRSAGMTERVGIACYDRRTGAALWQTWLGQTSSPRDPSSRANLPTLLSAAAGMVFVNTNSGIIAAVSEETGEIIWLRTHLRSLSHPVTAEETPLASSPNPCIYKNETIYALPTDGNQLPAIEADSGALKWQVERTSGDARLLAATDEFLLLSDDGLKLLDLSDGSTLYSDSSLKLAGYPAVVDRTILWPQLDQIRMLRWDGKTLQNQPQRIAIVGGANLAVTENLLVAATQEQLHIYRVQSEE